MVQHADIDHTGLPGIVAPAFCGAKAFHSTTQSIPDATTTALLLDSEEFDTDAFHDNSTNNSRLTVPAGKGGFYLLTGGATNPLSASPVVSQVFWRKNGGPAAVVGYPTWVPSTGQPTAFPVPTIVQLAAGDYVELCAYQDSSGARSFSAAWACIALLGS